MIKKLYCFFNSAVSSIEEAQVKQQAGCLTDPELDMKTRQAYIHNMHSKCQSVHVSCSLNGLTELALFFSDSASNLVKGTVFVKYRL